MTILYFDNPGIYIFLYMYNIYVILEGIGEHEIFQEDYLEWEELNEEDTGECQTLKESIETWNEESKTFALDEKNEGH